MFASRKRNKISVMSYSDEYGEKNGALLTVNGKPKAELLKKFNENYAITGSHVRNGGRISPLSMATLIGSAGGTVGMAGLMSGQLFMATANPATLMAIGNGVGSAVMGTGGVVAQAPFVSVAGAIMPVAAPLVAFQAISTIMIMRQFKGIHKRLDYIEKNIGRILQRSEATFIGEILSASNQAEELERQYAICNQFTQDMMLRLALLQEKVNPLFERYRFLYSAQSLTEDRPAQILGDDLKFHENDTYLAIVLSMLDLKLDLLRSKLVVQDSPNYIRVFVENLVTKIDHYEELWSNIEQNPQVAKDIAVEFRNTVQDMNWWTRTMPGWIFGNREKRIQSEENEQILQEYGDTMEAEMKEQIEQNQKWGKALRHSLSKSKPVDLVYWRDELGDHAYYTDDVELTIA